MGEQSDYDWGPEATEQMTGQMPVLTGMVPVSTGAGVSGNRVEPKGIEPNSEENDDEH